VERSTRCRRPQRSHTIFSISFFNDDVTAELPRYLAVDRSKNSPIDSSASSSAWVDVGGNDGAAAPTSSARNSGVTKAGSTRRSSRRRRGLLSPRSSCVFAAEIFALGNIDPFPWSMIPARAHSFESSACSASATASVGAEPGRRERGCLPDHHCRYRPAYGGHR